MGYDFHLLDYMCISDPKLSYADIIQSIGRGIRPDILIPSNQSIVNGRDLVLERAVEELNK